MDNLVSLLGGYNSWQFAVASVGCLFVGFTLYCFWMFLFPIPIFGFVLTLLYLQQYVDNLTTDTAKVAGSVAIPVFVIGFIICLFLPLSEKLNARKSDKNDKKGEESK